jgi:uncharacterized membrane protein
MSANTRHPKPRIESLSDLIFGLALSIGALSLLGNAPRNPGEIGSDLVTFGFSFLILISVWLRYTSIMSVLPIETSAVVVLNVIMLFLVSVEPYLFYLVSRYQHLVEPNLLEYSSTLFALDLGGLMAILAVFTHLLALEEKNLISRKLISRYKRSRNFLFLTAGLFFLTAFPAFWFLSLQGLPIRFYIWYAILPIIWIRGLTERPPSTNPALMEGESVGLGT